MVTANAAADEGVWSGDAVDVAVGKHGAGEHVPNAGCTTGEPTLRGLDPPRGSVKPQSWRW